MGVFDTLNGATSTIMEGVETDGMDFVKLKEFAGRKVPCKGFFFTKGNYGKSVVVVTDTVLINMPNWAVEKFETIQKTPEMLAAVLQGKMALDNIEVVPTKKGNDTVRFSIVEL